MIERLPIVSVIIPNYNHAKYLKKRIESIINQTYQDFELIFLDDASSDSSVDILDCYKENNHVTCVEINKENGGNPFSQWQKGIKIARGKYIWLAESDDWADLTFLERSVLLLEQYQNASFCFSNSFFVDEQGFEYQDDWALRHLITSKREYDVFVGEEYINHHFFWYNYVYNASAVVFRSEMIDKIDFTDCLSLKYSGDWLFWVKMAAVGEVIQIYKKLSYFRRHNQSTTSRGVSSGENLVEDMIVIKYIQNLSEFSTYKRLLRCGQIYKQIKRLRVSDSMRCNLLDKYREYFGNGIIAYGIEKVNKLIVPICPWVLTYERDRLQD